MENSLFQKVLDGDYYNTTETAPSVAAQPNTTTTDSQAINATMKLQGATSLPPNKAAELKRLLYEIGETIISMSELVHNEAGFTDDERYERVSSRNVVMASVSQVISLSAEDASRVSKDADLNVISQRTQEELTTLTERLADTFAQLRAGSLTGLQAASHLCALLLTVMERCTTLLGLVDKLTVKVICAIGNQCKGTFHNMHKFFVVNGIPTENNPDFDRYVETMFKPIVKNTCDTFSKRGISLTLDEQKNKMKSIVDEIQKLAIQFEKDVRGGRPEAVVVSARDRVGALVDEACALADKVPAFCVVMNIDKVSGDFDIKCAKFLNAVRAKEVQEVGVAGREITADVNEAVKMGKGVPGVEECCNDLVKAAADAFTLAKKAVVDGNEYPNVVVAVDRMKTIYACLPKNSIEIHSDSVNNNLLIILFVLFNY